MKSSYLKYIDKIEQTIAKIKNLDVDEQILDLYSELSMPSTQINVLNKVNSILELAKTKTKSNDIITELTAICNEFSEELKKDRKFDSKTPTIVIPEEESDDGDDEKPQQSNDPSSDIDDLV
jgi:hypothetical protein